MDLVGLALCPLRGPSLPTEPFAALRPLHSQDGHPHDSLPSTSVPFELVALGGAVAITCCMSHLTPPSKTSDVFTRRQRYRVPVWASRHPGLTAYIDEVVDAAKVQIEKVGRTVAAGVSVARGLLSAQSALRSIHVVLTSVSSGEILERYRFDLAMLLDKVPPRDRNLR